MNSMLDMCGSLAVLVSRFTILPVAASATYRSVEKTLRVERNASQRPSGLIAGPTFRSSPSPLPRTINRPISFGGVFVASIGSYAVLAGLRVRVGGHVELKRVNELVADHVISVGERTAERQHDAAPQRLGDATGALAELAVDRVGLLEVRMRRVENERLPAAKLVCQD